MTPQERDALDDLNDAIEDAYSAANLFLASGHHELASDISHAAETMRLVRYKLKVRKS